MKATGSKIINAGKHCGRAILYDTDTCNYLVYANYEMRTFKTIEEARSACAYYLAYINCEGRYDDYKTTDQ